MTHDEFRTWWKDCTTIAPSLAAWAAKVEKTKGSDIRGTMKYWEKHMDCVSLTEATDAFEHIMNDKPPKFDRDFENIPRAVVRTARGISTMSPSTRTIDGKMTVACNICQDIAFVTVWHPKSVAAMKAGTFGEITKEHQYEQGTVECVACSCPSGMSKKWQPVKYDPAKHCICEHIGFDSSVETLREFCKPKQRAKRLPNYSQAIADF